MTDPQRVPVAPITDSESAFAFVLGVLFNQRVRADDAWRAPRHLRERIGSILPTDIIAMPLPDFAERFGEAPAIHPFRRVMATRAYQAAELVQTQYQGDARNIWTDATATQFLSRMQAFAGIGLHKATVALFVATRELGITIRADGRRYSIQSCGSLAARYHPHHEPLLA